MTLQEAIKTLGLIVHDADSCFDDADIDALKLGIEALNRINETRLKQWNIFNIVLPGETNE